MEGIRFIVSRSLTGTMDDPLIGLTIYDNTQTRIAPEPSASTENGSYGGDTGADKVGFTAKRQQKKLWKVGVDDDNKECFPCLPGISEDQQNDCVKSADPSFPLSESSISTDAGADQSHSKEEKTKSEQCNQSLVHPKNYWLMRLFQSNLFTMSIGISYLFNSKDPEVLSYLGGRLYVSWRM